MEKLTKLLLEKEASEKVLTYIKDVETKLNKHDNVEADVKDYKNIGNGFQVDMEISFEDNMKKLATESLIEFLAEIKGSYITELVYVESKSIMNISFVIFEHKI